MPYYMTQVSYNSHSWEAQVKNPEDRSKIIGTLLEAAGGRLISFFYAFGEYDIVLIMETPDNATVASVVIAASAGGAIRNIKTTVLMSAEEGLDAIKKAGSIAYSPPG